MVPVALMGALLGVIRKQQMNIYEVKIFDVIQYRDIRWLLLLHNLYGAFAPLFIQRRVPLLVLTFLL